MKTLSVAMQIFDKGFTYLNLISSLVTLILKFSLTTVNSFHLLRILALEISDTFNFAFFLLASLTQETFQDSHLGIKCEISPLLGKYRDIKFLFGDCVGN